LSKNINLDKQVNRENTRLPQEFINEMILFNSNQNKKRLFESYENSDVVKLLKELKEIDSTKKTPMINGYKLIKDPKPIKEEISVPLITWDELLKTSNIMEPKSKSFFIQNSSDREKTLHNLLNKNTKNNSNNETDNANNFLKPTEKIKM